MARKVDPQQPVKAPPKNDGADDLAILCPDVTLTLAGREVTVREYRFVQGLRIRALSAELVRDLTAQVRSGEALTEDVLDVLAKHDELVRQLVLRATDGADAAWLESLGDEDGTTLLLTWWGVCGPFFVRQIARRIAQGMELAATLAGPTSSTSSPPSDMAAPTSSPAATPSDN